MNQQSIHQCVFNFVFFGILFFLSSCKNGNSKLVEGYLIQDINIVDAKKGLQEGMDVVLKDNRIIQVSPHHKNNFFPKEKIFNGKGKYVLPGLWDTHVHFAYEKDIAPAMFKLFLVNGITSVRDTGGKLDLVKPWKIKAESDPENAPRVMIAGPLLDGYPVVYDGSSSKRPPLGTGIKNAEDAKKRVLDLIDAGVDNIKAYEMLSPESFKAIVASANSKGLKVTGHIPLRMDAITASNAGMNSMEHLRNLEMSMSTDADRLLSSRRKLMDEGRNDPGGILRSRLHKAQRMHAVENQDPQKRREVLRVLAKNNTWQVPTLTIVTASTCYFPSNEAWRENFKFLPDSASLRWRKRALEFKPPAPDADAFKYAKWAHEIVKDISDAEVGIMAGTDCPIFFLTPGFSLHEELVLLVKSGLTPLQAIEAATIRPAQYFNMDNELGLVEKGMLADLLILDKNPLEDIKNTQKINAVIRDGKWYNRKDLDNILRELKEN
ncbi:MAG: amidohydrolase family protein [Saprospiraceae bacterium]|jgi:imidazolonepropionase-like amidohydrolase|nr:amidohydrolase family protein [Saprospiraceae bacterium]MDG1433982.1 amidohydrolase family protein [Saprospiraceae bacterium]